MTELISVIMSVYNETFEQLREGIHSMINQTYPNLEIIIINDNPTNSLLCSALDEICGNNKNIKIYQNEKNIGLVESLNRAIKYSSGDYIARMDPDDRSYADRIEKQLHYLKHNNMDLIGGNIVLIDEDGKIIGKRRFPFDMKGICKCISYGNCIPHPTWLGKRKLFEELNGYRKMPHCEDYDFILRAIKMGKVIGNIPDEILEYRIRTVGVSKSNVYLQRSVRKYLSGKKNTIDELSEKEILNFVNSDLFAEKCKQYSRYCEIKKDIKTNNGIYNKFIDIIEILKFSYMYEDIWERICIKQRNWVSTIQYMFNTEKI